MKKKYKKYLDKFKEIKKTPRGSAFLFFGFYFFFFLILILFIRSAYKNNTNSKPVKYEEGSSFHIKLNSILDKNYLYNYVISSDGVELVYTGEKNNNKEIFIHNNHNYYREDDSYFMNDNNNIVEVSNPYLYYDFINIDSLSKLLDNAYYESKTSYESGKVNYNFLLSSNTIDKELYNLDTDYFEEPNQIIISTSDKGDISTIELKLDSYCIIHNLCQNNLKIKMEFDGFGKVNELKKEQILK